MNYENDPTTAGREVVKIQGIRSEIAFDALRYTDGSDARAPFLIVSERNGGGYIIFSKMPTGMYARDFRSGSQDSGSHPMTPEEKKFLQDHM